MHTRHTSLGATLVLVFASLAVSTATAQTPAVQPPPVLALTAVSANVNGAGEKIDFFINKWSSDAERDGLAAAWAVPNPPAAADPAGRAAGARGATAPAASAPATGTPAAPGGAPAAAPAGGGRGGGRGGRGAAPAAPRTPEAALAAAVRELPAAGYFWTSEVGGYLIRYAYRVPQPAGGSRIILLTDKRLGAAKNNWRVAAPGSANTYEFTLIELRLPAKGAGVGKASITGTIAIDPDTKTMALEGYEALPTTLQNVMVRPNS
jgi:hypothetical protein